MATEKEILDIEKRIDLFCENVKNEFEKILKEIPVIEEVKKPCKTKSTKGTNQKKSAK